MKAFLALCFVAAAVADNDVHLQNPYQYSTLGSKLVYPGLTSGLTTLQTPGIQTYSTLSAGLHTGIPYYYNNFGYNLGVGAVKLMKREAEAEADPQYLLNSGVFGTSMYSQPIVGVQQPAVMYNYKPALAQPSVVSYNKPLVYANQAVAVQQPALYAATTLDKYQVNGAVFRKDSIDLATGKKIHQANSAGVRHVVVQKREAEAEPQYYSGFSGIPLATSYAGIPTTVGVTGVTGVTGVHTPLSGIQYSNIAYKPLGYKTYNTYPQVISY